MSEEAIFQQLEICQKQLGERWSEISALKETVERQADQIAALREELAIVKGQREVWKSISKKIFLTKVAVYERLADAERKNADRDVEISAQVESALRRSYTLGQIYWQQADSDSTCQQNKSDQTSETQAQHILNVLTSISAALNKPEEAKS